MSLSPEIRAVLAAGAKSVDAIAELISQTPKAVQTALHALKFQGKVRYKDVDGIRVYFIANWPEKAARKAAPPPQGGRQRSACAARLDPARARRDQRSRCRAIRHHRRGRARDQARRYRDSDPALVLQTPTHVHRARGQHHQPHGVTP